MTRPAPLGLLLALNGRFSYNAPAMIKPRQSAEPMLTNATTVSRWLIIILALALIPACQERPAVRLRYQVEKSVYQANRFKERLLIRPELITPSQTDSLKEAYLRAYRLAVSSLDSLRLDSLKLDSLQWDSDDTPFQTLFRQVQSLAFQAADNAYAIDLSRRDYRSARKMMENLLQQVQPPGMGKLGASLRLANAQQSMGDWDEAVAIYRSLITEFYPPLDQEGNVIPDVLHLPYDLHMIKRGLAESPDSLAVDAHLTEGYYLKLLSSHPSPELQVATHATLSSFYQAVERYRESLEQLSLLYDDEGDIIAQAKFRAWNIRLNNLGEYRETLNELLATKFVGPDSAFDPIRQFKIAECYLGMKIFDSCRSAIYQLKKNERDFFYASPLAQKLLALSFDKEGKWDRAETEYRWLIETFSTSEVAFRSYLTIIKHYLQTENAKLAKSWRQKALDFYRSSAIKHPGTLLEANALSFEAEIYRQEEDWTKAAATLGKLAERFLESAIGRRSALAGALIYRDYLNDLPRADSLFSLFKRSYPIPSDTLGG